MDDDLGLFDGLVMLFPSCLLSEACSLIGLALSPFLALFILILLLSVIPLTALSSFSIGVAFPYLGGVLLAFINTWHSLYPV